MWFLRQLLQKYTTIKSCVEKHNLTRFIQVVVNIHMFEWVPGIFALLGTVENQSHQVPVTADDLTGVNSAHNLHRNKKDKATDVRHWAYWRKITTYKGRAIL